VVKDLPVLSSVHPHSQRQTSLRKDIASFCGNDALARRENTDAPSRYNR
jgi:hypothetical protein